MLQTLKRLYLDGNSFATEEKAEQIARLLDGAPNLDVDLGGTGIEIELITARIALIEFFLGDKPGQITVCERSGAQRKRRRRMISNGIDHQIITF